MNRTATVPSLNEAIFYVKKEILPFHVQNLKRLIVLFDLGEMKTEGFQLAFNTA